MKRVRTRIGDVFSVRLDERTKKYLQYVANDMSQLNSYVIRAFKKVYRIEDAPALVDVVADEVDFYAHVVVKWGLKMGLWEKVGYVAEVGGLDVLFRDTNDYGSGPNEEPVKLSKNWYIWRINEEFQHVGTLEGDNRRAEIGIVVAPPDIVDRMRTGKYKFVYPGFE